MRFRILAGLVALLSASTACAQYEPGFVAGTGQWPATMSMAPGLDTHTLYHPKHLSADVGPLPIAVYSGSCRNIGNRSPAFLAELASHGYLVIAVGPISPYAKPVNHDLTKPERQADGHPLRTRTAQMSDAIDWAIRENGREGSPFHGRLRTDKVAVLGRSCGGLQALRTAISDPRVSASIIINSGSFDRTEKPISFDQERNVTKAELSALKAPILYLYGNSTEIAYPNAKDDLMRIDHIPAFGASHRASGHDGTFTDDNGGAFAQQSVAWLDRWLKGDVSAAKPFAGKDCGLCTDPAWEVERHLP
jgi:dienelactone hydrolase